MNRSLLLCIPSVYARQCVFLTVHLMAALSEFVCAGCMQSNMLFLLFVCSKYCWSCFVVWLCARVSLIDDAFFFFCTY